MTKKIAFWLFIAVLIFSFLYAVSDILFPFIFGMLVAYFFDPLVSKLESKGLGRAAASGLVILSFTTVLIALISFAAPVMYKQGQSLIDSVPQYYAQLKNEIIPELEQKIYKLAPELAEQAKLGAQSQAEFSNIHDKINRFLANILSSSAWLFNLLSLIFITPIVSFYILRDWHGFKAEFESLLPRQYAPIIEEQLHKINQTVSAFLRGQMNVCLILGAFYAISLTIVGLNSGLLIGFMAGMLCFIPYVGTLAGMIIALSVAFFQYGADYTHIGIIAAIFAIGQICEGNYLTPKIVGEKVGIHPAWLIFGMLAGGSLLGLIGVILAVPLTAIINVMVQFAIQQYESSEYYSGSKTLQKTKKK